VKGLLLEQILECLPRIERLGGGGSFGWDLRGLHVRSGSGVLFNRCTEFVKRAVVFSILGRNSRRDGLRAFKLSAGVKEAALLTTVQLKIALRTLPLWIESGNQHGATI